MVGTFQPLLNAAVEEGEGIHQHRPAAGHRIEGGNAAETVGAGGETFEEMAQQRLVVLFRQHVEAVVEAPVVEAVVEAPVAEAVVEAPAAEATPAAE